MSTYAFSDFSTHIRKMKAFCPLEESGQKFFEYQDTFIIRYGYTPYCQDIIYKKVDNFIVHHFGQLGPSVLVQGRSGLLYIGQGLNSCPIREVSVSCCEMVYCKKGQKVFVFVIAH